MKQLSERTWAIRCQNDVVLLRQLMKPGVCAMATNATNTVIQVTLNVPTFIVPQGTAISPALSRRHVLDVLFPRDYPYAKPIVRFHDASKRAAHPNVFRSGNFCIGEWEGEPTKNTDSILGVMERCIEAMSFCDRQVNLNSPASNEWIRFYERKRDEGCFPLFMPWWKGRGALESRPLIAVKEVPNTRQRIVLM